MTPGQAMRLQVLTVSARLGVPLETVESWPHESLGLTTIAGVHQRLGRGQRADALLRSRHPRHRPVPATVGDGAVLIPGGLQVTIAPEQEPQAWADPVEGVVLDLDDDLRVFATMEQAVTLRDSLNAMISKMADSVFSDDRDPTVNELLDRGGL